MATFNVEILSIHSITIPDDELEKLRAEALTDKFRATFYDFHDDEDIVGHLVWNLSYNNFYHIEGFGTRDELAQRGIHARCVEESIQEINRIYEEE